MKKMNFLAYSFFILSISLPVSGICQSPCSDTESLPVLSYEELVQCAKELRNSPYAPINIEAIEILDFPSGGTKEELGLVFEELNAIKTDNLFDLNDYYVRGIPRGSLDKQPIIVYIDDNNDGFYDLKTYDDLNADYTSPVIMPPINKAEIPPAGRVISRIALGKCFEVAMDEFDCPITNSLSSSTFMRTVPYEGKEKQIFGASHRAATYNITNGEQTVFFRKLFVNRLNETQMRILGLIDHESFTGAIEYIIEPKQNLNDIYVNSTFFPRTTLSTNAFGVLGFSTMFFKDENQTPTISNDEAHDSDVLYIGYSQNPGEIEFILCDSLKNPEGQSPSISSFDRPTLGTPVFVTLEQKDRDSTNYTKYQSANYHLRPSLCVNILSTSHSLIPTLYEKSTDAEYEDNIAFAMIVKDVELSAGDEINVNYKFRTYFSDSNDKTDIDQLKQFLTEFGYTVDSPGIVDNIIPENHLHSKIKLYPNPSTGSIYIDFSDLQDKFDIEILDIHGRLQKKYDFDNISSNSVKTINLNMLGNGIYLIRVKSKKGQVILKKVILK